ncbi:M48 family metalloprotease [Flavobacteriaceae bacterium R38]|nr:M48 family metalloprotease [Flavobacteriaceae bacterium R38]
MISKNYYPESPEIDRKRYTKINTKYQSNVIIVMFGIILFFIIYLAALYGSFYLVYHAIFYDITHVNKLTIILKIGAVGMSVMFSLFMIKFLFKKQQNKNDFNIEIKKEEHPKLFDFINKLSRETNAPLPKKVFVNHEINASVFYNNTILSLFLPTKKNLLIGLGLVNGLNLSEFKAVLAHEFGHFSQSSMRLGSYVYMANQIIYGMVYDRDYWDQMYDSWRNSDIRLAIFAWLLMPIVWGTRQLMILIYKGINILQSSLSRQMEYHADLVAVSVTGSDAIINGLYKLDATTQAMNFAMEHVNSATHNKIYTSNLFYHQDMAFKYLKDHNPEFEANLLENIKSNRVFVKDDDYNIPSMYASHPSGYKRENNAKQNYLTGEINEGSPWILFNDPEKLCEKVTQNLIKVSLNLKEGIEFTDAKKVQEFIQSEISETQFNPIYLGSYDTRFITDFDAKNPEGIIKEVSITKEDSSTAIKNLYETVLKEIVASEKKVSEELQMVVDILGNVKKDKVFNFRGKEVKRKDAQSVYEELIKELDNENQYEIFDKKIFATHYLLANDIEKKELIERYDFQHSFQKCHKSFIKTQSEVLNKITEIQQIGTLEEKELYHFAAQFYDQAKYLKNSLENADTLQLPIMSNMQEVNSLKTFLLDEKVQRISSNKIDGDEINQLLKQLDQVIDKARRLYFKGLGNILKLQEEIRKNI